MPVQVRPQVPLNSEVKSENLQSLKETASIVWNFIKFKSLFFFMFVIMIFVVIMILSTDNYDRGCIRDNGYINSSILKASGYRVFGDDYNPDIGGGQQSEWKSTGYKTNGQGLVIDIKGSIFTNDLYGIPPIMHNRCRVCAKPREDKKHLFKFKDPTITRHYASSDEDVNNFSITKIDNCLCTKITGVGGITKSDLNNRPNLNYINIREKPTALTDINYCPDRIEIGSTSCSTPQPEDIASDSNWSCTDKFFFDENDDNKYNGQGEEIKYNDLDLKYINLNYRNKDFTVKDAEYQESCYDEAAFGVSIGIFGPNGGDVPNKTYHLYSEFYLQDVDKYRYSSPNNVLFQNHVAGEEIKIRFNDGYYRDNLGKYNIYFVEGILNLEFDGIITNIVDTIEGLLVGDGTLEATYKRIVGNTVFQTIVRLALILYMLFIGFGILSGTMEISRKEFFGRILKICLILFFVSPNSWSWYNGIVVGFFMGSIDTISGFILGLDFMDVSSDIVTAELQSSTSNGYASKFAFPDEMIKSFFLSENIFIKLWSLIFSPYNIAALLIIVGMYIVMIYFIYVIIKIVIFYLSAITSSIILLSLGPIAFILTINKITSTFFFRWLVYIGSRAMEIVMVFLVLYAFLSIINDKLGLYGEIKPESLLYFESCPYSLFDYYKSVESVTYNIIGEDLIYNVVKSILSFFRIYVADPTSGIDNGNGVFVGGKDFFEMIFILIEVIILLYFLDMIISQVGVIASGLVSYQQQSSRINSAIGAIANEGSAIFAKMMNSKSFISIPGAMKSAGSSALGGIKQANRMRLKVIDFADEHDGAFRYIDNVTSGRLSKVNSNLKTTKPGKVGAYLFGNRDENNVNKLSYQVKQEISSANAEYRSTTEVIRKNRQQELESQGYDSILIEKMLDKEFNGESVIRSNVINNISSGGMSADQLQAVTTILNRHFAEQDIKSEMNFLKKEDKLLTNIRAAKEIRENILNNIKQELSKNNNDEQLLEKKIHDRFKTRYLDNKFDITLQKIIKENLTDKEVFKNFDNEIRSVVSDLSTKNILEKTTKTNNELQGQLLEDPRYKHIQRELMAHQSYNKNNKPPKLSLSDNEEESYRQKLWNNKALGGIAIATIVAPPIGILLASYRYGPEFASLGARKLYRVGANNYNSLEENILPYVSNYVGGKSEEYNVSINKQNRLLWQSVNKTKHEFRQLSTRDKVLVSGSVAVATPIFAVQAAILSPFVLGMGAVAAANSIYRYSYRSSIGLDELTRDGAGKKYISQLTDQNIWENRLVREVSDKDKNELGLILADRLNDPNKWTAEDRLKLQEVANRSNYQSDDNLGINPVEYDLSLKSRFDEEYQKSMAIEKSRNDIYNILKSKQEGQTPMTKDQEDLIVTLKEHNGILKQEKEELKKLGRLDMAYKNDKSIEENKEFIERLEKKVN